MRDVYMKNGQAFILLYSVTSQRSFDEALCTREQILRVKDLADASHVPIILCGLSCDREEDRVVSKEQREVTAAAWELPFFEVSTTSHNDVVEVFVTAVKLINRILGRTKKTQAETSQRAKRSFFRRLKNFFSGSA